jgi:hypothetical protein
MNHYLDLFSPQTYEAFNRSARDVSGFRQTHEKLAQRVQPGDRFICYMSKISRWFGVLEVLGQSFIDSAPIFYEKDDPFVVRFKVKPLVWLAPELAIPAHDDLVWTRLSFTKDQSKQSSIWAARVRGSLSRLKPEDAAVLEGALLEQHTRKKVYPLDKTLYAKLAEPEPRIGVTVPTGPLKLEIIDKFATAADEVEVVEKTEVRESLHIQALLADIGTRLGMRIWIPKGDRQAVLKLWNPVGEAAPLDELPLTYDADTNKTIHQIDVLWLKRRAIVRAFEVEHTTSIYSGILRMADLLSLQPNINIKLHIVAPSERRNKVFDEVRRPVFAYLENGPLSEKCSYLSYESLKDLAAQKHLAHFSDTVLDEYEEFAEDTD